MLRTFCDRCGSECEPRHASSRRFESLAVAADGKPMGFEIIPLFSGGSSSGSHVCDNCMPELLEVVVESYTDSALAREKFLWSEKLAKFQQVELDLDRRILQVQDREAVADDKLRGASERISIAEAQHTADIQRIQVLEAQLRALQHQIENTQRQALAQAVQREEDARYDPEYLKRIAIREKKRASG